MKVRELALRSGAVLDIPPNAARLLSLVGVIGVVLVVAGSLVGDRPETIEIDKLIHFSAYGTLATVFVLSLPLRWAMYPLIWLTLLSYAIELLQPFNMRSFDVGDAIANTLGVTIGAGLGLAIRYGYGYVKTELESARIRRSMLTFPAGATLLAEGQQVDKFYAIRRGSVVLYKQEPTGDRVVVTRLEAGKMFGLLPEVLKIPQPTTVVAETPVQIYPIDYDELVRDIGGPQQPLGIVIAHMADELRNLNETIVELKR